MKKIIAVLLILSITIVPAPSHANGLGYLVKTLFKNKVESKARVNKALYENELHREQTKTLELLKEKELYLTDKQVKTLKNSLDDRIGDYGKDLKTKKSQLSSIKGRLRNKKLTIDDHLDFQEWLKDIVTNDLTRYDPLERYQERFGNIQGITIPTSPAPVFVPPVLVPAL